MPYFLPRPPYIAAVAVAIMAAALNWFVQGLYCANLYWTSVPPRALAVPIVALPIVLAVCGMFLLRGHNWARFAWWFAVAPFWLWCAHGPYAPLSMAFVGLAVVVISVLLATPNAHWYFTGRDYKKRPRAERRRRRVVQIVGPKTGGRSSDFKY